MRSRRRDSLAGVDNAFSAKVELESARAAYQRAQSGLTALRRSLGQRVRAAYTTAEALRDALRAAQEGNATEQTALKVQQARFADGSASRVELLQAEIDAAKSAALVRTTRYDLARAVLALGETVQGAAGAGSSSPTTNIGLDITTAVDSSHLGQETRSAGGVFIPNSFGGASYIPSSEKVMCGSGVVFPDSQSATTAPVNKPQRAQIEPTPQCDEYGNRYLEPWDGEE